MLLTSFHLSRRDAKAARVVLAAGALAGLAVLGACADSGGNKITAPTNLRNATASSGGFGLAKTLTLCVSSNSPTGSYTFVNDQLNRSVPLDGPNNALSGNGFFHGTFWYDPRDGGTRTTDRKASAGRP